MQDKSLTQFPDTLNRTESHSFADSPIRVLFPPLISCITHNSHRDVLFVFVFDITESEETIGNCQLVSENRKPEESSRSITCKSEWIGRIDRETGIENYPVVCEQGFFRPQPCSGLRVRWLREL
jgi:hypothetical protein